jgi:hypothetical protein
MKKLTLSLGAFLVFGATLVAWTAAPTQIIRGNSCAVYDANGVSYLDTECRIQRVHTSNGYLVQAQGTLPEGAALPDRSLKRDYTELNPDGCFLPGDRGMTTLTPSGNFNISCHPAT